jgi:hypothetical protein
VYQPANFSDDDRLGTWQPLEPPVWNAGQYAQGTKTSTGEYFPEREYNQVLISRAIVSIRAHAHQLPRMLLAKLNRFFLSRGPVENLARFGMVYCFVFGELLLLAGGGRATWALQAVFAANLAVGVAFHVDDRLRMPADMVLLLVGSYGFLQHLRLLDDRATYRVPERVSARAAVP